MKKKIIAVASALSIMLSSGIPVLAEDFSLYTACESSVVSVTENATEKNITVAFDSEIKADTVTDETFYITKDGSSDKITVSPTVSADNKSVTFSTEGLENGAKYTVIVNGVKCSDGETDVTPSENFAFTVGAPKVKAQNIKDGASPVTNVVNASEYSRASWVTNYWDYTGSIYSGDFLELTFSENIKEETVTNETIKISKNGSESAIAYTPVVEGSKVKIDLSSLQSNFTYDVNISAGVKDENGAETESSSFSFTTGLIAKAPHVEGKTINLVSKGKTATKTANDGTETTESALTDGVMEGTQIICAQWSDTNKEFFTVDLGATYNIAALGAFRTDNGATPHNFDSSFYVSDTKLNAENIGSLQRDVYLNPFGASGVLNGNNNDNAALSSAKNGRYVTMIKAADNTGGPAYINEILVFAYVDKFEVTATNIKNGASPVTNVENASSYTTTNRSAYWDYKNSVYEGDFLEITFSKNIAPETVTKDTVKITKKDSTSAITYTPIVEGNKIKIDLSSLQSNFTYNVNVTSGVQNADGLYASAYSLSFTTGLIAKAPHVDGKTIKLVSIGKSATKTANDGTETAVSALTDGVMEGTQIICAQWSDTNKEFFTVDLEATYNIAALGAFRTDNGATPHNFDSSFYVSDTKLNAENIGSLQRDAYLNPFGASGVLNGNNNDNAALSSAKNGRYVTMIKAADHDGKDAYINEILVFAYMGTEKMNVTSSSVDNLTVPVTNVSNATSNAGFAENNYQEKIEITFEKDLDPSSVTANSIVITQDNISKKMTHTPKVQGNKVYIDMCNLECDREYTIKVTGDVMATDTTSAKEKEITFKTGLIAKAPAVEGKAIKLVSNGKTVTNSTGGYEGVYNAEYSQLTDLQTLTNGKLESGNGQKVQFPVNDYVTVDLGANYEVAAVGAYWPDSAWHLYTTSVFVTADKPSAENMKSADVTINYTSCWEGPNNSFNKNNTVKEMTAAKDGRYVSFKKTDGAAYLSELYVFAYVDKTAKADFYFVNNEASVEAKVEGENAANYNVFTASYKDGKLVEVKQGAVQKGENLQYKGFVWNKTDINPILPSINF